jgi:hypothetical protein
MMEFVPKTEVLNSFDDIKFSSGLKKYHGTAKKYIRAKKIKIF